MRTAITLIEVLASIVAWTLFGLLLAFGAQWAWNSVAPGAPLDMAWAFTGYGVLIALWLLFVSPLKYKEPKEAEEDQ